ncbi:MAG: DUF4159 domain-containing protein [Flavobacteriaceae bacterium]|nr:DUF4159 domain-containing protein [Flavobacteriaceae bacterium]
MKHLQKVAHLCLAMSIFYGFNFSLPPIKLARLKYSGGGDWYLSPTSLPNLIKFCNQTLGTSISADEETVEPGSPEIFNYPLLHITGHGNMLFSDAEARNLRKYLESGGFLNINDSYGMDKFIRREMKKVFPELDLIELPFNHPIYHTAFEFANGLPKIHQHDNKPPQGFGITCKGRLVCFYNYECDLGDGWENPEIHKDAADKRLKSLQMGANIVRYAFGN